MRSEKRKVEKGRREREGSKGISGNGMRERIGRKGYA
jgi:hypothetical protein